MDISDICFSSSGMGAGGGWEAEGRLYHPSAQRQNYCVFKAQKQPQCTCQAKTVVGRSLTPHVALLVCSSGIIYSLQWTVMNLQGQKNAACESRPGYIFSPVIGVSA